MRGRALVAQGGGPTAVINQTLVGIIEEARRWPQITGIYGALNGVEGLIKEELVDLSQVSSRNLAEVAATPSSALLSTRAKPDEDYCRKIYRVLKAHDIRYFFYIGGNDSSDTVRILSRQAQADGYEFRAIHVPKTIDNDLLVTDHTPGFGSAARFVAQAFAGMNLDMKAMPGVYIGIVMGRHAGFLTAAAAAAKRCESDGPHLICLPEHVFSLEKFLQEVEEAYKKYGYCVAAVSEGISDETGEPVLLQMMQDAERDAHGNVTLSGTGALGDLLAKAVKKRLAISRVRGDTFGYLQRSFLGCVSDTDAAEAREAGEKAVHFALHEGKDGSVTLHRTAEYRIEYRLTPLEELAGKTKYMPEEFIDRESFQVTEAFQAYLRPLLGTDMPEVAVLQAPKVEKKLNQL